MLASLFDPDKLFWRLMSALVDVLMLSVLWLFCSLLILPLGAATAALYDAAVKCVRPGRHGALGQYYRTFRREFTTAMPSTVLFVAAFIAVFYLLRGLWSGLASGAEGFNVALAACLILMLLPIGAFCWAYPILSRFSQSPLGLVKIAFQFAIGFLPRTVVIVLLTLVTAAASLLYWFPLLFSPCLLALAWSFLMERPFHKFIPAEPQAEPEEEQP